MQLNVSKPGGKREGNSSPLKKKPMVTMAKDKLDGAIAKAVTTALQEQQGDLNSLICSAVTESKWHAKKKRVLIRHEMT